MSQKRKVTKTEDKVQSKKPASKQKAKRETVLRCSFCGKSQQEVKKLIAGPIALICDECITICNEVIANDNAEGKKVKAKSS